MKKLVLVAMLLCACDSIGLEIDACGTQCRESGNAMKSYSRDRGCECVVPEPVKSAK